MISNRFLHAVKLVDATLLMQLSFFPDHLDLLLLLFLNLGKLISLLFDKYLGFYQ